MQNTPRPSLPVASVPDFALLRGKPNGSFRPDLKASTLARLEAGRICQDDCPGYTAPFSPASPLARLRACGHFELDAGVNPLTVR
jgi:hypothetical protein